MATTWYVCFAFNLPIDGVSVLQSSSSSVFPETHAKQSEMPHIRESFPFSLLLADRTHGRAYATVLRLSSSVTLCIVAKRCVLEQKLLLRAYRKSYIRNRLVPK